MSRSRPELAEVLMRQALAGRGPLAKIGEPGRLLKALRLVAKLVAERRDREAYSLAAMWPQRKIAKLAGVTTATMQGWITSGGKLREGDDA